jgi:hypothetical protein
VQRLECALSIAQTQQREKPRTSPMAYVEEEISKEPIQVPLKSLLFTMSDDWHPPNHNLASTSTPTSMEGATCIIEEEFPEEFLHLDSMASIQNTDNEVRIVAKEVRAVEARDTTPVDMGTEVEGHPIFVVPDFFHASPLFFHPEKLELVLELRNQMSNHIHRDTLMHQRIDMIYDAFLNAPAAHCCPN